MRRKECEVSKDEAWKIFDESPYCALSCVDHDRPYVVVVSCARINETIYFHCAKEGKKLTILKSNPNVCLSGVGKYQISSAKFTTYYDSCVIDGIAHIVESDEQRRAAIFAISEKYANADMDKFEHELRSMPVTELVAIEVTSITGKRKKPK